MPFTSGNIEVAEISATKWQLLKDVTYQGKSESFIVEAGRQTDFASVPRIFFWLFPSYGTYTKAAILHDYLCETGKVPRDDADGIFRRAMRELGVPFLRRWMMWAAVRLASGLKGAKLPEIAIWVAVFVPSLIFLFIPAIVIACWLALFWVIELVWYWALKIFAPEQKTKKKVVRPRLDPASPVPMEDSNAAA